jgi:hypothetical protein
VRRGIVDDFAVLRGMKGGDRCWARFCNLTDTPAGDIHRDESSDKALRLLSQTIGRERKKLVDYILRRREHDFLAFDDNPFETASFFVAMALGKWSLRLGMRMLDELTDRMIEQHTQRVTRIILEGLAHKAEAAMMRMPIYTRRRSQGSAPSWRFR